MLLWEMVNCAIPFADFNQEKLQKEVGLGNFRPEVSTKKAPKEVPSIITDMIKACWQRDPAKRPTFTEIKSNNYSVPQSILGTL